MVTRWDAIELLLLCTCFVQPAFDRPSSESRQSAAKPATSIQATLLPWRCVLKWSGASEGALNLVARQGRLWRDHRLSAAEAHDSRKHFG